jgi:hypothetical protein
MNAQPSPRGSQNPDPQEIDRTSESDGRPESRRGGGARARLTIAPDVARRRLKARLLVWGVALVTVASMFMLVSFHVFAAQSAFTLERLSKERTNEQLRYQRLRNMVADRSSAPTVIKAAKALGMVNGPTQVNIAVPSAGGPAASGAIVGAEAPDNSYEKAKSALGPTP